ncbi:MAG: AAA family ATPase [Pseudonocardiaceae bacterium]|nr:AAA family ATPase [Pseudonocardiaceae bacterium]
MTAVEDAVMAGAQAALEYLQDKAGYARIGHHGGGAGRWIDAQKFVVAQFLQHDSRDRDPQLHVHQAILNRVFCADGQWRALDTKAIYTWRAAAAAIGMRVTEARLAHDLGVRVETRPDGKAREVVGIGQEIREWFSSRDRAITRKAQELIDAFTQRFGRDPSALERSRLSNQATLVTRRAKEHRGETLGQRLDRWEAASRAKVDGGLATIADDVLDRAQQPGPPAAFCEDDVIERAMASLEASRGTWGRADALWHLCEALPGHLGVEPDEVLPLLAGLTDKLLERVQRLSKEEDTSDLPDGYVLANGTSSFEQPGSARYATVRQLAGEHALRRAAVERGAAALSDTQADAVLARFAELGAELGADQAAALRGVLTSGARVEVLAAAAGTGKSFTVGALAETWAADGRRVVGLAPSQVAANVLAEDGVPARNVAAWLATQDRLERGRAGGEDEAWRLRADDLVIVDEAAMTATPDLAAIHQRCQAAGAKLLLVGDPRQLAAVGPSGALADVAERGIRYELAEVRRFHDGWEGPASLALRDGDVAALDEYQRHGRLVDAGTAEQAETAAARTWLADTLAGHESLLLVSSNETAARACARLRARLVDLGHVEPEGMELARQGTVAGVGDLVQARRNGWELIGVDGNTAAPLNRATYRVTALRPDGGLTVAPILGRTDPAGDASASPADGERLGTPLQLPPSYVTDYLTLGYASTVHAAQGRTVDTVHAVIGSGTDAAGAYVAMTRGRDRNTAYAVTRPVPADAPTGAAHEVAERTARGVLSDVLEHAEQERSALAEAEASTRDAHSTRTHADRLIAVAAAATTGRTASDLDRLAAAGLLSTLDRQRLAADDGIGAVDRLLRAAEISGFDRGAVLVDTVGARDFRDARSPAQVLHGRLQASLAEHRTPTLVGYADLIPADVSAAERQYLLNRAEDADARRRELGAEIADHAPQWAREALGPVPADPAERAAWDHAAGWAASWRELVDHTDETDPLGPPPPGGLIEKHTVWRTAAAELQLTIGDGDEHDRSDGQLRARVRALQREEAWAPRYVGDELDATQRAAQRARADAQLWAAHADATADATEAQQRRAITATARSEAAALDERITQLEDADTARARWYAATAATRDAALRARGELHARGIDLDDPAEQVTADEWLAAHRAEQAAEDAHRDVDEIDPHEPDRFADRAAVEQAVDADRPLPETAVPDVRDTAAADVTEHADPSRRHRMPGRDETAEAVTRAQAALAEIAARREADEARQVDEIEAARREELARWAEHDQAADQPDQDRGRDDHAVLQW